MSPCLRYSLLGGGRGDAFSALTKSSKQKLVLKLVQLVGRECGVIVCHVM